MDKMTILNQTHRDMGARMVPFGGWDMPIQYAKGIVQEHLLTRKEAGVVATQLLFDGMFTPAEVERQTARINSQAYRVNGVAQNISADAVEVYLDGDLVGGLYGLRIERFFAGEGAPPSAQAPVEGTVEMLFASRHPGTSQPAVLRVGDTQRIWFEWGLRTGCNEVGRKGRPGKRRVLRYWEKSL